MTEKLELYKCDVCGNITQVIINGDGELVCCNQPMELLVAKTQQDEMLSEKHVPVFKSKEDGGEEILIGSIPHPMTSEHYIMFIEVISADGNFMKLKYLHPGEEAKLELLKKKDGITAKEYCNIHGLWEAHRD